MRQSAAYFHELIAAALAAALLLLPCQEARLLTAVQQVEPGACVSPSALSAAEVSVAAKYPSGVVFGIPWGPNNLGMFGADIADRAETQLDFLGKEVLDIPQVMGQVDRFTHCMGNWSVGQLSWGQLLLSSLTLHS